MDKELHALKLQKIEELKELETQIQKLQEKEQKEKPLIEENIQTLTNKINSATHVIYSKNEKIRKLIEKKKDLETKYSEIDTEFNSKMVIITKLEDEIKAQNEKNTKIAQKNTHLNKEKDTINKKIRLLKQDEENQKKSNEALEKEIKSLQSYFDIENKKLAREIQEFNDKMEKAKSDNYDKFIKLNKQFDLIKTPHNLQEPNIIFMNLLQEFQNIITNNIANFINVYNSINIDFSNDERNYFNVVKKYLQISGYIITNDVVIHYTQPINQQVRDSITGFIKSNFCNILINNIDNVCLKIVIEKTNYDTLISYFEHSKIFKIGDNIFHNVHKFLYFMYFLGNNGSVDMMIKLNNKIKEKTK